MIIIKYYVLKRRRPTVGYMIYWTAIITYTKFTPQASARF